MGLSWQLSPRPGRSPPVAHTDPVTELTIETDPAELGLDKERLKRIDAHFARYVEDGRLAGWLLTIGRHGHLAHVARCGSRDLEAGVPGAHVTPLRVHSFTHPVTLLPLASPDPG